MAKAHVPAVLAACLAVILMLAALSFNVVGLTTKLIKGDLESAADLQSVYLPDTLTNTITCNGPCLISSLRSHYTNITGLPVTVNGEWYWGLWRICIDATVSNSAGTVVLDTCDDYSFEYIPGCAQGLVDGVRSIRALLIVGAFFFLIASLAALGAAATAGKPTSVSLIACAVVTSIIAFLATLAAFVVLIVTANRDLCEDTTTLYGTGFPDLKCDNCDWRFSFWLIMGAAIAGFLACLLLCCAWSVITFAKTSKKKKRNNSTDDVYYQSPAEVTYSSPIVVDSPVRYVTTAPVDPYYIPPPVELTPSYGFTPYQPQVVQVQY
eukprot:NODE_1584_length_1483_cov_31.691771_g1429_i0.p1 GENE.NODE_1584_length_1483_cov_31.691771_g1429_i0~~NODE_1584_length_1483_cov_31.691771_g1429_i0.p1  ORF type:complete len:355 (+),score=63.19 NODE_1584_length_1483_cov_31.691771_g1429_i0:98-1066(+)